MSPKTVKFAGLLCIAAAVLAVLNEHSIRRDVARARDWPTVTGQLTDVAWRLVREFQSARRSLQIKYEYEVDGIRYAGSRLAMGVPDYSPDFEAIMESGEPVDVYYNPETPAESALQIGQVSNNWHGAILLTLCGAGAIYCFAMARRGNRKAPAIAE
jgi:hypothetical protein